MPPVFRRLLLSAFSAILTGLAFPNASLVWLLPVCLVPLFFATRGVRPWPAFQAGWIYGTVFWLVLLPWIAYTVRTFGEVGWVLAVGALLSTAVILGFPFALMTWTVSYWNPWKGATEVLAWVVAWGVQEGLRTHFLGGFPWGLLAAPLADFPALAQTASIGSVYLPSLLLVLVNQLLFHALRESALPRRIAWAASAALVVGCVAGFGIWRIGRVPAKKPTLTPLRIALLQPGVSQERRWTEGQDEPIYRELMAETWRLAREEKPDLILWPESATPYNWPWSRLMQADLHDFCRSTGVSILLNTVWTDEPSRRDAPFFNSALLVTPSGPVLPVYSKQRLVPFGEYVPFGSVLRIIRPISRAVPESFSPGSEGRLLPLRDWKLGGAVCYEIVYPWIARDHLAKGGNLLFTLTNDAWYGKAGARRQHWQLAVFRSIETGLPLFRVAATGISGWVDPWGRTKALLPLDSKASLTVTVGGEEPGSAPIGPTVASKVGEGIPLICSLLALAGILDSYRRRPLKEGAAVRESARTKQR
jgi:apolipoprotein N-acyltransferase